MGSNLHFSFYPVKIAGLGLKQVNISTTSPFSVKNYDASQSPLDTEFFEVIETVLRRNSPQALIMPILAPGFTDSRWLREQELVAYGLIPCLLSLEEIDSIHGRDEKLSLESFKLGIKNTYEICLGLCAI